MSPAPHTAALNFSAPALHTQLLRVGGALAALAVFSVGVSTAAVNIFCALVLLAWLFSQRFSMTWQVIRTETPVALLIILYLALALSCFYSVASPQAQLHSLSSWRKLLLIPVFVVVFEGAQARRWAVWAFALALGLTLLLSFAQVLGITLPKLSSAINQGANVVFKRHITQSWLMAWFAFGCLVYAHLANSRFAKISLYAVALLALINTLWFVEGRTGQVSVLMLLCLWFVLVYRLKGVLIAVLVMTILVGLFSVTESAVKKRFIQVASELNQVEQTTSSGLRYQFYKNSLQLIAARPWQGYGAGSVEAAYAPLTQGQAGSAAQVTRNAHNDYLNFGIQLGLPGIALFVAFLAALAWRCGHCSEPLVRWLGLGFVAHVAVTSLVTSPMLDFSEGHFITLMTAWLLASARAKTVTSTNAVPAASATAASTG